MNPSDHSVPEIASRLPVPRVAAGALSREGLRSTSAASPPSFNMRVALRALTRHWWQILLLWVVGSVALTALIYTKLQPSYEAVSKIRIEPASRELFGSSGGVAENFESYIQTQKELILSNKVLIAAMNDPRISSLPRIRALQGDDSIFKKYLTVAVIKGTFLIDVSMKSSSPTEAAAIVNAVVNAYLDVAAEWSEGATRSHIANLESYYQKLQAEADEKQKAWLALADKGDVEPMVPILTNNKDGNTVVSAPTTTKHSITLDQYKNVMDTLFQARADLIEAECTLEVRKNDAESPDSGDRLKKHAEEAARADPDVADIAEKIRAAQMKRDDTKRRVRSPNDPAVTVHQRSLEGLVNRYNELLDAKMRILLHKMQTEGEGDKGTLRAAEERAAILRQSVQRLEQMLDQLEVRNKEEGGDTVRIALIRESLESLREIQVTVLKKLEELRLMSRAEPRISRINEAQVPRQPVKDTRAKAMAVAPLGLMVTLLAFFVVVEIRADRIGDPDDLSARGRFEILGIVPPLPGPQPSVATNHRASLEYNNRVQELDQSLEHLRVAICGEHNEIAGGRCVMITSATGGEGKTNFAVQLAARCARSGESTLLIDADLRRTILGQLLDLDRGPGLSDVLQGDVSVEAALVEGQVGGFHLLPAGTLGKDPSQLLKGRHLEPLLEGLRRTYDVILIDTPPVLPVPDALTLGRWCDGAILAVRYDNSRFPLVERARRRLATAGIPVLGAVVTGMRPSKAAYGTYVYGSQNGRSHEPK